MLDRRSFLGRAAAALGLLATAPSLAIAADDEPAPTPPFATVGRDQSLSQLVAQLQRKCAKWDIDVEATRVPDSALLQLRFTDRRDRRNWTESEISLLARAVDRAAAGGIVVRQMTYQANRAFIEIDHVRRTGTSLARTWRLERT